MKLYYYISFILGLSVLFLMQGCVNEDMGKNKTEVIDGIPTTVQLKFELPEVDHIQTRAMEDKTISDLYIFSFKDDRGDNFVAAQKYPGVVNQMPVTFKTVSGAQYIYAIANPTNDMLQGGMTDILDSYLKGCTRTQLFGLVATLGQNSTEFSNTTMLMSGLWKDDKDGTACTIQMNGTTTSSGKIELKRVGAKVNFSILPKKGVSFTLEGYQVCEVPSTAPVFDGATVENATYFSTEVKNISTTDNKFSFYMLENKATGRNCETVHDRELLSKGSLGGTPEEREFLNVDKPATYVLLYGRYKGPSESQGKDVEAKVTYCIHLGKGAGASSTGTNDFNTNRNCNYTYNLTVNGVDNIIAEVIEEGGNSPREEGEVIIAGTQTLIRCDAHFDAREITFNKEKLKSLDLNFIVKDPSTGNSYVTSEDLEQNSDLSGKVDLSWVLFRNNAGITTPKYEFPKTADQSKLMKVDELIKELEKWIEGESTVFNKDASEVKLTAFINEYYYPNMYWRDFVNTDDREMMIIYSKKYQQPANGNSSILTSATYMIQQRSIKTVYSQEGDYNAWGIESVNETGMLDIANNPKDNGRSSTYGRVNMNVTAGSSLFVTYLDYSKPQNGMMMNSRYQNAYYACLQRNRDENGNGKIDQSEIKWYLPAQGQYLSLWIGKTALTAEASIFNINWNEFSNSSTVSTIPSKYHYVISDGTGPNSNDGRNWQDVLWAEEGITVGQDKDYASDRKREYRCVRDLNRKGEDESNLKNVDHQPESIFTARVNDNDIVVNLTYLNSQSLKPVASTGELDNHHERSDNNKPYKQFVIAGGSVKGSSYYWNYWVDNSPCAIKGNGWRMPNQSELAMLYLITKDTRYSSIKDKINDASVFARTAYSGVAKNWSSVPNTTHAYRYNEKSNISLAARSSQDSHFVRCVKDL